MYTYVVQQYVCLTEILIFTSMCYVAVHLPIIAGKEIIRIISRSSPRRRIPTLQPVALCSLPPGGLGGGHVSWEARLRPHFSPPGFIAPVAHFAIILWRFAFVISLDCFDRFLFVDLGRGYFCVGHCEPAVETPFL